MLHFFLSKWRFLFLFYVSLFIYLDSRILLDQLPFVCILILQSGFIDIFLNLCYLENPNWKILPVPGIEPGSATPNHVFDAYTVE